MAACFSRTKLLRILTLSAFISDLPHNTTLEDYKTAQGKWVNDLATYAPRLEVVRFGPFRPRREPITIRTRPVGVWFIDRAGYIPDIRFVSLDEVEVDMGDVFRAHIDPWMMLK